MKRPTTDRPLPADVPPEQTARTVANGVARLDLDRAAAYAGLSTLRTAKAASFVREQRLLSRKYGANHPRVAAVATRRAANAVFQRDLAVALTHATTPPPAVDAESYVFHGFVRDCNRQPLPRLTVALYDANGAWISELGYGCTGENGYFLLRSARVEKPNWIGAAAEVRVYDAQQKLVHREAEPLRPALGVIDYREIIICEEGICTPPPGGPDQPPPEPVTVPDVIGILEASANAKIRSAGLTVESSTQESTAEDVGRVIEQNPKASTQAAPGSVVNITVGIPRARIAVPNVAGQSVHDARATLGKAELTVGKIEPADAPLQSKVVKQSPAAGEQAERGSAVDLVVEPPVEKVAVPQLVELTLAEAKKAIVKSRLAVGTIKPAGASDESRVVEQSPATGTQVEPATAVDLVTRPTPGQVAVPEVVGMKLIEAKKALDRVRLKVGKISPSSARDESVVAKQSPVAGAKVDEGAAVDLDMNPALNQPPRRKAGAEKKPGMPRKKRAQ